MNQGKILNLNMFKTVVHILRYLLDQFLEQYGQIDLFGWGEKFPPLFEDKDGGPANHESLVKLLNNN